MVWQCSDHRSLMHHTLTSSMYFCKWIVCIICRISNKSRRAIWQFDISSKYTSSVAKWDARTNWKSAVRSPNCSNHGFILKNTKNTSTPISLLWKYFKSLSSTIYYNYILVILTIASKLWRQVPSLSLQDFHEDLYFVD